MTIRTKQHGILNCGISALLITVNNIGEFRSAFACNFQANCERLSNVRSSIGFIFWQIAKGIAAMINAFGRMGAGAFGNVSLDVCFRALLLWRKVAICLPFIY